MNDTTRPTARGKLLPARPAHGAARHRLRFGAVVFLVAFLLAGCAPNRIPDPPVRAAAPAAAPTVEITEEDVADQKAANAQRRLERSIRRDFERTQNWSDSDD